MDEQDSQHPIVHCDEKLEKLFKKTSFNAYQLPTLYNTSSVKEGTAGLRLPEAESILLLMCG